MSILVTGGAGYIGSVAVEQLCAAGQRVIVLDNLSQGHREAVHPKATFIECDLASKSAIDEILSQHKPETVMHFAAHSLVGESMKHPFQYLGSNVTNGINLLSSMIEHGIKRFILSSTANLFDAPHKIPIDEEELIVPGSPYGESKFILERMLHWLDRIHSLRYATLRYFNAAGASVERGEDHSPELHLIPIVLEVARGKRDSVTIFGNDYATVDGTCVRDYIHVSDLAQAHILAMNALDQGSRTYNLGNGQGFSVKQVIDTARKITGHPIPGKVGPRRAGDPPTLIASSEKIRRDLGWQPQFADLRRIIESAWQWHQKHPSGYSKS